MNQVAGLRRRPAPACPAPRTGGWRRAPPAARPTSRNSASACSFSVITCSSSPPTSSSVGARTWASAGPARSGRPPRDTTAPTRSAGPPRPPGRRRHRCWPRTGRSAAAPARVARRPASRRSPASRPASSPMSKRSSAVRASTSSSAGVSRSTSTVPSHGRSASGPPPRCAGCAGSCRCRARRAPRRPAGRARQVGRQPGVPHRNRHLRCSSMPHLRVLAGGPGTPPAAGHARRDGVTPGRGPRRRAAFARWGAGYATSDRRPCRRSRAPTDREDRHGQAAESRQQTDRADPAGTGRRAQPGLGGRGGAGPAPPTTRGRTAPRTRSDVRRPASRSDHSDGRAV